MPIISGSILQLIILSAATACISIAAAFNSTMPSFCFWSQVSKSISSFDQARLSQLSTTLPCTTV
jgi:hypothetical protein